MFNVEYMYVEEQGEFCNKNLLLYHFIYVTYILEIEVCY